MLSKKQRRKIEKEVREALGTRNIEVRIVESSRAKKRKERRDKR